MRDYWDFVAPAVRERLAAGRHARAGGPRRDRLPRVRSSSRFGDWDGPERLIVSADTIARNDAGEIGRPGDVARLGLLSAMGRLGLERASAG